MTTYVYTEPSLRNQQVNLLTNSRPGVQARIVELTSTLVNNASGVAGTTVTDALNTLAALITAGDAWDHVVKDLGDLPAPVGGFYDLTSGSWAFAASLDLGANVIRVPLGETVLMKGMGWNKNIAAVLASGGTRALEVDGTAVVETMHLSSDNFETVYVNNAAAQLWLRDCLIENMDDGPSPIALKAGTYLRVSGGRIIGTAGVLPAGVFVDGAFTDIYLEGVVGSFLAALLTRNSGAQGAVTVSGCRVESNCTRAINWAAANVPTQGMSIIGNRWNIATAYTGITAATARVNMKSNLGSAGLLQETAIVP